MVFFKVNTAEKHPKNSPSALQLPELSTFGKPAREGASRVVGLCVSRSSWGLRVSGFGFRIPGLGFQVSGFGIRTSDFGFRVSGFGFRVSGFGFRVLNSGSRVSGFGLRVSGFECRVSGSTRRLRRSRIHACACCCPAGSTNSSTFFRVSGLGRGFRIGGG